MSGSSVKKMILYVSSLGLDPKEVNKLYKSMKRSKVVSVIPVQYKAPKCKMKGKRHYGEPNEAFKARRLLCNKRSRQRETHHAD